MPKAAAKKGAKAEKGRKGKKGAFLHSTPSAS